MNGRNLSIFLIVIVVVLIIAVAGGGFLANSLANKSNDSSDSSTKSDIKDSDYHKDSNPVATIKIKDIGTMKFELYPEQAPQTVDNFIYLANNGFYDGLTMHRIDKGFVAQGGDPSGDGSGGPGYSIKGEFSSNNVDNPLVNEKGSLTMARSSDPDSAGSQFYINLVDNTSLDGDYAVFGSIISGQENLDNFEDIKTKDNGQGEKSEPVNPVIIESISVDTKGKEYSEPKKLNEDKATEKKYSNF